VSGVTPEPSISMPEKRPTSELVQRVVSSLALAGCALASVWFGGFIFAGVWSIAALVVLYEWSRVIGFTGRSLLMAWSIGALGLILSVLMTVSGFVPPSVLLLPVIVSGVILALWKPVEGRSRLWVFCGPLYAAIIVVGPLVMRLREADGIAVVTWLYLVVWISDIGAYFVGRGLGGPRLWPAVSPKKTWSGSIGGLFFGSLVPILFILALRSLGWPVWANGALLLAVTVSTALVSELGDLFESAMKRRFGVKDSGAIIPGHGGLMDRLDSYAAAAGYLYLLNLLMII